MINNLTSPRTIEEGNLDDFLEGTVYAVQKGLENFSVISVCHWLIQKCQMQKEASNKLSERSLLILLKILSNVKHDIVR